MVRQIGIILAAGLFLGMAGCGKRVNPPVSGQDLIYQVPMEPGQAGASFDPEQRKLERLREAPSVRNASI